MKIAIKIVLLTSMLTASGWSAAAGSQAPNPDPWEAFNRKVFAFNDFLDRYFLKPVAKTYNKVTPQFLENGVHNMFSNIGDIGNTLNALLQAKFKYTAEDGGRVLVNSTVGLLGFFDVASKMGLEQHEEDFGLTLGRWGVPTGPYLVVPFFGPRTVRSGFGSIADAYSNPLPYMIQYVPTRNEVLGGRVIDSRAQLLSVESLIVGDRYTFIRDAYLQQRQFLLNDGKVSDSFGNDEFMNDDFGDGSDTSDGSQPSPQVPPPKTSPPKSK